MDKRLLLLGILLFIAGFVIAASSYNPTSFLSTSTQSIAIAPNSIIYSPVTLNSTGFLSVVYESGSTPIDFYVMNQSAFSSIETYIKAGTLTPNLTAPLEGKGLLLAVRNSTGGIFPYNSSYNSIGPQSLLYLSGNSTVLQGGTYYVVYQNPGSSAANATYRTVIPNSGLLLPNSKASSSLGLAGIVSALLVLVGIVLTILSFMRSKKEGPSAVKREEEIAAIYKDIETRQKRKAAKRRKKQ